MLVFCFLTSIASSAQTLTTLHTFSGPDGATPVTLIQGGDDNFYGTTFRGGAVNNCQYGVGCGTIFEITPTGSFTLLQSFDGTDGFEPSGLVQAPDGTFYGQATTSFYSIIPGGTLNVLNSTGSFGNPLILGADGNFYGAFSGQLNSSLPSTGCTGNCGSIFQLTPVGALTTLYTFDGTGGYAPTTLVQGSDGNFYGVNIYGGNYTCGFADHMPSSCGTIFKLTPAGVLTTLYSFCSQSNCSDGYYPSSLIQGTDGNFYGTTIFGGNDSGYGPDAFGDGTIFRITPAGVFTTMYVIQPNGILGGAPSGLLQAANENFYGVTGGGTVFEMTPSGLFVTLYSSNDGAGPNSLAAGTGGTGLYGTTSLGGSSSMGTVFNLAVPLNGTAHSTTSLTLSPSGVVPGSTGPVVMTATVVPASGTGAPTGTVAFLNGINQVGSANLNGNTASFNYNPSSLTASTYEITAFYIGDATFADSTSTPQTLTVGVVPASTPSFSPVSGSYTTPQTVTISDSSPGASIYYTTDGSTPTIDSALYSNPIAVNSTETINAIAGNNGYSSSAVASATYTITLVPDFQIVASPSSLNIMAGQSGTATITVTPMNGFNTPINFACSGLPAEATCTFNPTSVTPNGNPVTSTLTVSTTAPSAALRGLWPGTLRPIYALFLPCAGMTLIALSRRKTGRRIATLVAVGTVLVLLTFLPSCGGSSNMSTGGGNGGTPAGTNRVTVSAATTGSGSMSHSAILKITVTQ